MYRWIVHCVSIVLLLFASLCTNTPQTPEELKTWQDILDDESVEILYSDEFEVINPHIKPPPPAVRDVGDGEPIRFKSKECPVPPNFPSGYGLVLENFINWAEDLRVSDVWTVQIRNPKDVVKLANWAYIYGYKLRARGFGQSWAPITVTRNSKCSNTIMVDTTKHLTQMRMVVSKTSSNLKAVYAQTGTSMENLLQYLKSHQASLYAAPVTGESTVGGVLAVGGHGIGIQRRGSTLPIGFNAGSLSNLVLSFKAVVWDQDSQSYVLRKFSRNHEDAPAFLTHIGRAFLTEVLLMVGPAYNMRCENRFDSTADEILGMRSHQSDNQNFARMIEKFKSVELNIYPYSQRMWTSCCYTTRNTLPNSNSRYVDRPYPFQFSDGAYRIFPLLTQRLLSGLSYLSPLISQIEYTADMLSVRYNQNEDIWGQSSNMLLRYKNTMRRTTSSGYAILTRRDRVQKVVSDIYAEYTKILEKYSSNWRFPQNEPLQISITGLDEPQDIPGLGKFAPPALSFLSPMQGEDYDTAVFLGINSIPGTRHYESFMREIESFLFLKYDGNGAIARPEWSKAWGFTDYSAWDNHIVLKKVIPSSFGENWGWAVQKFDQYDPYMVFSNDFLDVLLKANKSSTKWKADE